MPRVSKEEFVRRVAQSLDLPEALVERLTEPRAPDDERGEGWKIVRMPWLEELKEFGLEGRFASAGWRTALRAILED
ncbi:MAG TPA: hypothetical protein VGX03_31015 [Candidatus Binatia bacterium]|jgi:hypothetical protein|nr:hypothetical protein [Candidatus Binatia bacterium]